ncbi:hypothetical protein HRG_014342 [Hirsutella rhossiliensis]
MATCFLNNVYCSAIFVRLDFCWGIFPDRAAEWWKPSDTIKKNLKDESIAEEIKRAKGEATRATQRRREA